MTQIAAPPSHHHAADRGGGRSTPDAAAAQLGTDPGTGLTAAEVVARRERYGPNTLTAQAPSVRLVRAAAAAA